jgi:hypothetical protein
MVGAFAEKMETIGLKVPNEVTPFYRHDLALPTIVQPRFLSQESSYNDKLLNH